MFLLASSARADSAAVNSDAAAQSYDVRSPTGQTVLLRRRVTTTVAASATDLLGQDHFDPKAPELSFRIRLRYDADYGIDGSELDPTRATRFVPGVSQGAVDLMVAYVEGRRFLGGALGFRLGRQVSYDVLGPWAFDGAEVSVTTPAFLRVEMFGGLEERTGMPLASSRFESDGVWRGDRANFGRDVTELYTSFQPEGLAPAFGAAIESVGPAWIHGRLTYRRVEEDGTAGVTLFRSGLAPPATYDRMRLASERLGYALDVTWRFGLGAKAGAVYDGLRAQVTSLYASVEERATGRLRLSAEYAYSVPSFDGDSVWNFFTSDPRSDVALRAQADVTALWALSAGAEGRLTGVGSSSSPGAHRWDEGLYAAARYRRSERLIAARAVGDLGPDGHRVGGDISADDVLETRYLVHARAGVYEWRDALRPDSATSSFGMDASVGYRFAPRSRGSVQWEHEISGLAGQRFRIVAVLALGLPQ